MLRGFLETSFLDWPGRLCSVVFTGGCNFRCPYCHNHVLVQAPETVPALDPEWVVGRLRRNRRWLGGVCISGGEPTLHPGLAGLAVRFKAEGFAVKLDTNGSRPEVLAELLDRGLLDFVAMDVKAPLEQERYDRAAGAPVRLDALRQSIALLRASGIPHQFRMTVTPFLHTEADVQRWAEELAGPGTLTLQNFSPRATLDPSLANEQGFSPDRFAALQRLTAFCSEKTGLPGVPKKDKMSLHSLLTKGEGYSNYEGTLQV